MKNNKGVTRLLISTLIFATAAGAFVSAQVVSNAAVHRAYLVTAGGSCYHGAFANYCTDDTWQPGRCGPDYWNGICQLYQQALQKTWVPSVPGHQCDTLWQGVAVICVEGSDNNITNARAYMPPPPGG